MNLIVLLLAFLLSGMSAAQSDSGHLLAVSQGVSSPSSTSTVNFSSGFTSENAVGSLYQNGARVSGQFAQNGDTGFGAELGYGADSWGVALGYYDQDCDGCDERISGVLALEASNIGFGLRLSEDDLYGLSVLVNPQGDWRWGLVAELNDGDSEVTSLGAGMAFGGDQWTFAVDVSHQLIDDSSVNDDAFLLTPGLLLRAEMFQVSVNYQARLNDDNNDDGDLWFGLGVDLDFLHIAAYLDYVDDIAVSATFFF